MARATRPTPWKLRAALVLASLATVAILFSALEGFCRLTGLGAEDPRRQSAVKYQQVVQPIFRPARRPDGTEVLHTVDPRLPYQQILATKPAGALRVFTFGGSATAGLGYSPNVTFTRHLERLLRLELPHRPLEVINLGIVAFSSRQVALMAEEVAARYEPDLILVYSGNNEFLELHAEKLAYARAGFFGRLQTNLSSTNVYRLLAGLVRGPPEVARPEDLAETNKELRLTQSTIVREIETTPGDVAEVLDRYEANLGRMAAAIKRAGCHALFLTVGSNWEWRGRKDLEEGWLAELLGTEPPPHPAGYERALAVLDDKLSSAPASERHQWLFRRAVCHRALGNAQRAAEDYRAAMNADPRYRRALDAGNQRVQRAARAHGLPCFDVVGFFARRATNGVVGFDEFYDYVHFTPRGTVLLAAALFDALRSLGAFEGQAGVDPQEYVTRTVGQLESLERDTLDVDTWHGFSFDRDLLGSRDLWKYEEMVADLDQRLTKNPRDAWALAYRGNARSFGPDGAAGAAADWRAALAIDGSLDAVRVNLERLLATRP